MTATNLGRFCTGWNPTLTSHSAITVASAALGNPVLGSLVPIVRIFCGLVGSHRPAPGLLSATTTRPHGKLLFGILASIAEFETALRKERQMEGIRKAQDRGDHIGRPKTLTSEIERRVRDMRAEGATIRAIAAAVGYSTATVQKIVKGTEAEYVSH